MATSNVVRDGSDRVIQNDKKRGELAQEKPPPPKHEWPLFLNPTLLQLQVTGYEINNGIVYFTVVVTMPGFQWEILKTYDEFQFLHRQLCEKHAIDKTSFPQKKMFGTTKKEYLLELLGRINQYLLYLLKQFIVPPILLLRFLEYKFSDVLSITETLAALFYDRGEEFLLTNSMVAFSPLQFHCICKRMTVPITSEQKDMRKDFGHLLDFLQNLKKVKVCPPSRELFPLKPTVELTFDLSVLKSVDTLVFNCISIELIKGFGYLPQNLVTLACHQCISSLREVLKHIALGVDGEGQHMLWPKLRLIDFSYNTITTIDSSLLLAPDLEELNLSHNEIKDMDNLLELPRLRILDLSYNQLMSLELLNRRLGNITTLCLAHNKITSLEGLSKCYSIVCLDIQNNLIAQALEIKHLSDLPLLEQLMVRGNPFAQSPSYRHQVFSFLHRIVKQVSLDGKPGSKDELKVSEHLNIEKDGSTPKTRKAVARSVENELEQSEEVYVPPHKAGHIHNMEQMRKEAGDDWLKLLNQKQPQGPNSVSKPRRKHRHHHHKHRSGSGSDDAISTASPDATVYTPPEVLKIPTATGLPSQHMNDLLRGRECNSPWTCTCTVLEYNEEWAQLSDRDIDQLLTNRPLEACLLLIDTDSGRATEDYGVIGGVKNRTTRDLTFLRDVRVHEGDCFGVAMKLTSFMNATSWIIYSVKDYPSLADLYVLLTKKLKANNSATPPSPALLSKHIKADTERDTLPEIKVETSQEECSEQEEIDAKTAENSLLDDASFESAVAESPIPPEDSNRPHSLELSSEPSSKDSSMAISPVHIPKPGLADEILQEYFRSSIATEKKETLMHVLWCSICLPSSFPHEIEGVVFISNACIHVLEVKTSQSSEWTGLSLPLHLLISSQLERLSRVTVVGVFDQNVHIELRNMNKITSFVVFPPTSELTVNFTEQLKAALDAVGLDYTVMKAFEAKTSMRPSGILFVTPDESSLNRLKQWLSRDKQRVRLGSFIATHKDRTVLGSYEVELKQGMRELAESFDIVQQLVVSAPSTDRFPCNHGNVSLQSLSLILTNTQLFLCQESYISGPALRNTSAKYTFPPLYVLRSEAIASVRSVTVCDCSHPIVSPTNWMYQFTLTFSFSSSSSSSAQWHLCTHSQQYSSRFISSLSKQWELIHSQDLPIIHKTSLLPHFIKLHTKLSDMPTTVPVKQKPHPPLMITGVSLLQFISLPHWAKLDLFKSHIAQADFVKADEMLLTTLLAHVQPPLKRTVQVEIGVIISNYAIYLLSDVDGIRAWLDAGGVSSFARMSLLNPEGDTHLQCFYRLWLTDLTRVRLGPLLLSLRIYENKPNSLVDIITGSVQATCAIVTDIANVTGFKEQKEEKEMEQILQELNFVDVTGDDPFGDMTPLSPTPPALSSQLSSSNIELTLPMEKQINDIKLHLVESHPDVAAGSSVHSCSESLQILAPQVMLLAEQLRVKESLSVHYTPHIALWTNYGLFLCSNSLNSDIMPPLLLLAPTQLAVKRWVRVADIQRLQVAQDSKYHVPQILLYVRTSDHHEGFTHLCLVACNSFMADVFVYYLSLVWEERMGRTLPVEYLE